MEDIELIEDPSTYVDPEEEIEEVTEEEPEETPEPSATLDKSSVYKYLQENPNDFREVVDIGKKAFERPAEAVDDFPMIGDFETYEDWGKAIQQHTIKTVMASVGQTVNPLAIKEFATSGADQIAREHNVPEAGKAYLQTELAKLGQPMDLDPGSKEILARAARDYAREQSEKSRGNGRARHAEPVAGVGPQQIQLAPGTTRDGLNLYLKTVGKDIRDKTVQAELRRDGYIK